MYPRYSDNEFGLVQKAAELSHMALGGYVAESSLAAARSDAPTAAVADYRAAVKTLMDANRQLAMVGNNLNPAHPAPQRGRRLAPPRHRPTAPGPGRDIDR
ncbi:hypothetical protein RB199_27100 [Streptomyces libani]